MNRRGTEAGWRRFGRRAAALAWVLTLLCALAWAGPAPAASAEASDVVNDWSFTLQVRPDGALQVSETMTYAFSQGSGRHGILRELVIREPYDDEQDAVYRIEGLKVSSPDASDEFTTGESGIGRHRTLRVRIGSADRTITGRSATYTLTYTVRGALRGTSTYDELTWDLVSGEAPRVNELSARVRVPGGVRAVDCSSAPAGEKQPCASASTSGGEGLFRVTGRPQGHVVTVAAKIAAGQVRDARPILEPRAVTDDGVPLRSTGIAAAALTAFSAVVGVLVVRRKGRDLRFEGLPPGTLPPAGSRTRVVRSGRIEVPVAFSPPRIAVAEAGLLVDGQVDVRETAATLVDLATRGALTLQTPDQGNGLVVTLVDASLAQAPHEGVLLESIFAGTAPGARVDLSAPGALASAHQRMVSSVTNQVASRGWFTDVPHTGAVSGSLGLVGAGAFVWFMVAGGLAQWWPILLLVAGPALVWCVVRSRLRRGQRTALGRAVTDQVEGFETYLTTAEADQLRFEEGEDIFSRYLPWAIMFGVAQRWARVCQPLVEQGRIPAPTWYVGGYWDWYVVDAMLDSLQTSAAPAPVSSSGLSGTGFGGGSGFGSGGTFSGLGGGGGSVSSW